MKLFEWADNEIYDFGIHCIKKKKLDKLTTYFHVYVLIRSRNLNNKTSIHRTLFMVMNIKILCCYDIIISLFFFAVAFVVFSHVAMPDFPIIAHNFDR